MLQQKICLTQMYQKHNKMLKNLTVNQCLHHIISSYWVDVDTFHSVIGKFNEKLQQQDH